MALDKTSLRVEAVTERAQVDQMIRKHYLSKWPGVTVGTLSLMHGDATVGVCVFALPPKQTYQRYGGLTWELARLWIDDAEPRNSESWFIARAIRWVQQNHPDVVALVSYADPSAGHCGTIYKAANWIADGMTDQERKTPRFDYKANGKRYSRRGHIPVGVEFQRVPRISKYRFYYPLHKRKPDLD